MYELFVLLSIPIVIAGYGAVGGWIASERDKEWHEALVYSYFWTIILIMEWWGKRKNAKKKND